MVTVVDLKAEPGKLRMLEGRTPTTSASEREGAFTRVATYRDGGIFMAKFAGTSAWERHPNGDELVQVLEGAATMHLMADGGRQSVTLDAGMVVVVPQNVWHQFVAPAGVCIMTTTPQPTQHLDVDVEDPRTAG